MKSKKERIIEEWKKAVITHPSYRSIARKVGVNHSYVQKIINDYKKQTQKER